MGRQIAVLMNEQDENNFLEFLNKTSDVEIFTLHASTIEGLKKNLFSTDRQVTQFYIWNKSFPWEPDIGQSTQNTPYIKNIGTAPVVEYSRERNKQLGKLYWEKIPHVDGKYSYKGSTYLYDIENFEDWYENIINWVKKNSVAKGPKNNKRYYLKYAWRSGAWFSSIFYKFPY
jgi:hypothetical protein